MVLTDLLFALCLGFLPFYLDNWFHDRQSFELRRAVYATRWQRWMMDNRNAGRFGSLAFMFAAAVILRTDYVQTLPILTVGIWIVAIASFLSFMAFQILPHGF